MPRFRHHTKRSQVKKTPKKRDDMVKIYLMGFVILYAIICSQHIYATVTFVPTWGIYEDIG